MQAIVDACKAGRLNARVCLVISNNSGAMALQRAKNEGIPSFHFSAQTSEQSLLDTLREHEIQLIFLAGYLKKIGPSILEAYEGNIYNIHPSLLPKYGGKGMYGINVHKAVLAAGEKETGVTIHRVDAGYDTGAIIAQRRLPVHEDDTPETLAARVLKQEHIFIVEILEKILLT
jgi:phosphoribosylglycinamide formyltransferase-1